MKLTTIILAIQLLNIIIFILLNRILLLKMVALLQQVAVYKRRQKRPHIKNRDRLFWSLLSQIWQNWRSMLIIVKPETVLRWQKKRFREYWRKKSKPGPGRPRISKEHISYIQRISSDHPEYGKKRIALELEIKFGIKYSPSTVRKYMVRGPRKPRGTLSWKTFLQNQAKGIWMCDFFTQYTVNFAALYVFVVMELESRKIVHWNVTRYPTLDWIKQQFRGASFEGQPKFIIHDNDGKYGQFGKPVILGHHGKKVSCRSALDGWLLEVMGIRGIPTPFEAPNAAAHVERLIGTLRLEVLDKMII